MKRVHPGKRSILSIGLIALVGLLGACLAWRETVHRKALARQATVAEGLSGQLATARAALQSEGERSTDLTRTVEDQLVTIQSLQDRTGNLEAQRDHLRLETDRLASRIREAESLTGDLQVSLEGVRLDLLQAVERPRELEARLAATGARIEGLELRIDEQAAELSQFPPRLAFGGHSSDGSVFSLSGELGDESELPVPVYICGADGIYIEGWVHRREGQHYMGHTERWRVETSTLVKGQKVFILPRHIYEADQ
jgi:hypothetical protein